MKFRFETTKLISNWNLESNQQIGPQIEISSKKFNLRLKIQIWVQTTNGMENLKFELKNESRDKMNFWVKMNN